MAILIKNPETERKARELANRCGQSITAAIDGALDKALVDEKLKRRRPTVEEMEAATERLWAKAGKSGPQLPVTKADWDEINEVPGLAEEDE